MGDAKKLYRFDLYCGRMGSLEGVFAATEQDVTAAYGKRCYFGEVLGKHSEIRCKLAPEHLKVLTDDADFIAKAETYGLVPTGFNPLDAIDCPECGERIEAPYTKCGSEESEGCGWEAEAS